MFRIIWVLLRKTLTSFMEDGALSRGAAVAFYTGTSLAPLLLIVVSIAGLVFGQDAARDAIARQFGSVLGQANADMLQTIIKGAGDHKAGAWVAVAGVATLIVTASGVFGEVQTGLNAIWKVPPKNTSLSRIVKARAASLGLVAILGFLMMASLVVSAALSALGSTIDHYLPFGALILGAINNLVSFGLLSVLFASIYKILPDSGLQWRETWVGAMMTALLFIIGKSLIGFYLSHSAITSSYGAASAPIIILLWIYYSSQIFFLGAEFTKAYAETRATDKNSAPDSKKIV